MRNLSTFSEIVGEMICFEGLVNPLAAEDDTLEGTKRESAESAVVMELGRDEVGRVDAFSALGKGTLPCGRFDSASGSSMLESPRADSPDFAAPLFTEPAGERALVWKFVSPTEVYLRWLGVKDCDLSDD